MLRGPLRPKSGVAHYYSVARACFAGVSFADCGRFPALNAVGARTGPRYRLPRIDPQHFARKVYNDAREEKGGQHASPVLKGTRVFAHGDVGEYKADKGADKAHDRCFKYDSHLSINL